MDDTRYAVPGWMRVVLPIAGILLFLGLWQALAQLVVADAALLPTPAQIARNLRAWMDGGGFTPHLLATLYGTLGGLAIGAGLGFVLGVIVGEVRVLDRALYPMALALQAMPVVAIAPLVIVWFGIGLASKVALVAIGTFFVMFINTVAGMHAAPPELLDMGRAFGGNRWRIALAVKVRASLDYVFSGLEVCAALSFILCVVGEFLAANAGLGYYLRAASYDINAASMFAAIVVLAALASLLALAVRLAHHRAVFWKYRKQ
ncbi:ABC transporter permease [Verticiella sediminum]|uniref:ABC transporter permease n=1 Tax=Verticiella sediminum TaxID=1247510 RepID=A0A556AMW0_9BURK|nr:ABC transporter permease [Verticiella sediminum]TSH94220.1 ABC transporter permease [Verticiella sediminum]